MVSWLRGMNRSIRSPMLVTFSGTSANGEKSVAAANDGLIGVVGVEMEAAATEDLGENVAGSGDSLASCSSDANSKGLLHLAPSLTEPEPKGLEGRQAQTIFVFPIEKLLIRMIGSLFRVAGVYT